MGGGGALREEQALDQPRDALKVALHRTAHDEWLVKPTSTRNVPGTEWSEAGE